MQLAAPSAQQIQDGPSDVRGGVSREFAQVGVESLDGIGERDHAFLHVVLTVAAAVDDMVHDDTHQASVGLHEAVEGSCAILNQGL